MFVQPAREEEYIIVGVGNDLSGCKASDHLECANFSDILGRQHQPLVQRVVVVAQHLFVMGDFHIVNAGLLQDQLRCLSAGKAGTHTGLAVPGIGGLDPRRCEQRQGQSSNK